MKKVVYILFSFVLLDCKVPSTKVCTEEARAGLTVFVKDEKTNLFISDTVQVQASDGSYSEQLQFISGNPISYAGAWERPGAYILKANKLGYKAYTSDIILVEKDECHVLPKTYTIALRSN